MIANGKKYLTPQQTAIELGVSDQHVYSLIKAGHLRAFNISVSGRVVAQSLRVSVESIARFMKQREVDPDKYFE